MRKYQIFAKATIILRLFKGNYVSIASHLHRFVSFAREMKSLQLICKCFVRKINAIHDWMRGPDRIDGLSNSAG